MSDSNGHEGNRDSNTGRFVRGNTAAKGHRGTRDRLAEHFLRELHEVWREYGKPALLHLAQTDQAKFVHAVIQSLPRNDTVTVQHLHMELLTDEELVRIIREAEGSEDTVPAPPNPAQLN